jgi:hypothetical protein
MGDTATTTTTQVSPIMMNTSSPDAEPGNGKQSPKRRSSSQRTIFGPSWPQQDLQSLEKQAVDQLKAAQTANALVESALKNMKEPNGSHTAEEFQQALQTLLTYLLNIKHHPESVHFKKIGVHNPNFKWKVQRYHPLLEPSCTIQPLLRYLVLFSDSFSSRLSVNGAVEMLLAVGFRLNDEGDCLELHDSHMDKRMLDFLIDRLQRELTLHFQHTRTPSSLPVSTPCRLPPCVLTCGRLKRLFCCSMATQASCARRDCRVRHCAIGRWSSARAYDFPSGMPT